MSENKPPKMSKSIKDLKVRERQELNEHLRQAMNKKAVESAFWQRLHQERKEADREKTIALAKESQDWRINELEQEEILAVELNQDKCKEITEIKQRQQLRESPELKLFEQTLRKAYAAKELAAQIAMNEARRKEEEMIDFRYAQDMSMKDKYLEEENAKKREEEAKKRRQYRNILQDQIIDKYKAKQEEYKKYLEEKALTDEAARTVLEEDRKEEELRLLKVQQTKEEEDEFLRIRALWIEKEKEKQEEEDRRVRDYLEQKFAKEKLLQEENKAKQEVKAKHMKAVANVLKEVADQTSERENITQFLIDEEIRSRDERKMKEDLRKQIQLKAELKELFSRHVEESLSRLEEERAKDLEYKNQLHEQYIESKKEEQLEKQKHKEKEILYGKELQEEIERKHCRKLVEMKSERVDYELQEKAMLDRRKAIEDERLRLLQEHASKLVGFLPKGLLRESDLPLLGPDVQKYYSHS